jgi:hypothetical protein
MFLRSGQNSVVRVTVTSTCGTEGTRTLDLLLDREAL